MFTAHLKCFSVKSWNNYVDFFIQCQFIDSILTFKTAASCYRHRVWEGNDGEGGLLKIG